MASFSLACVTLVDGLCSLAHGALAAGEWRLIARTQGLSRPPTRTHARAHSHTLSAVCMYVKGSTSWFRRTLLAKWDYVTSTYEAVIS